MKVTAGGPPISVSVLVVDPRAAVSHVDPAVAVTRVVPLLQVAYIEIATSAIMDDSGLYQYKADMAIMVDSAAIGFTHPETDSFSLGDASLFALNKGPVDSVGTSDVVIPVLIFLRDFTETLNLADTKVAALTKPTADTVTTTDIAPVFAVSKTLADAFAMNDMADIGDGIAFQFDDYTNNVVTMSDGTVVVVAPTYSDSFALSEAVTQQVNKVATDSATGTDALAISFAGAYTDSTTLTDNLANNFGRATVDSFGQSDTTTLAATLSKTDSFAFSEAGSMLVQDYVVANYFAEDYVGARYTF